MKKTHTLILLFILFVIQIQAQSIYMTLSLQWKVGVKSESNKDRNNHDLTYREPFLVIRYKNISNQSIYFYKPTSKLIVDTCISSIYDSCKIQKYCGIACKNRYNVVLDNRGFLNQPWEIINYNDDYTKEHEIGIINDYFTEINKIIISDNCEIKYRFVKDEYETLNSNEILKDKNYFCFLIPGEECEDQFNIKGLMILKGSYRFIFTNSVFTNSILINPKWSATHKIWTYSHYNLPVKFGNYNLYSSTFHFDSITISF